MNIPSSPVNGTAADEIVTRLYRRFKDWSQRGFGPDDVTWCEVKADISEMIAHAVPAQSPDAERIAQLQYEAGMWKSLAEVRAARIDELEKQIKVLADGVDDYGNETYEIGKRDGYEDAIQNLDLATDGDGEFKGSTIPGETVDVPVMQARIIARFAALSGNAGAVEAESSIDFHQLRGRSHDIIQEAITTYDEWMLDDDYEATPVLRKIIERMRERIGPIPAALDPVTVERCAQIVDECNREGPYNAIGAARRIRALLAQPAPSGNAQEAVSSTKRPDPVVHDERFPSERSVTHTDGTQK
jgi:hypothetical protein